MIARNKAICDYYLAGHKLVECASHFQLGRQRVLQILKAANVWKPYIKQSRDKFLGVNVSQDTKDALRERADAEGTSVSKLSSDILERAVR